MNRKPTGGISSPPAKLLVKRRAKPNYLSSAIKNRIELSAIHELFADKSVNFVRVKTKYTLQLFNRAIEKRNTALVQIILDKYPKVKSKCLCGQLLFSVLDNDDVSTAEVLIRAGVYPNVTNSAGMTLLQVLVSSDDCRKHDLAVVAMDLGARVNAFDLRNESSVVHEAIKSGCPDVIQRLIQRGADPNKKNSRGQTALFCAAQRSDAERLLPAFVGAAEDSGVPKYLRERRAADALCYLTKMGADKIPAMKAILEMGFPVDFANKTGETALNCAVRLEKINKIKLLLSFGANPNQRDKGGFKPLWVAASLPSSRISSLLIAHQADIHSVNRDLQLPLHAACRNSSVPNIRLLLRNGAHANVVNRRGETPFFLMKNPAETEAGRLVIVHFAFSTLMGRDVHETDLLAIHSDEKARSIYEKSLAELVRMTEVEVCNGIKYDCFYTKSVEELSVMARNQTFVKKFYESYKLFPVVFPEMRFEMDIAVKRRNIFLDKEQELIDMFEGRLPRIFLRTLAEYLCHDELIQFDEDARLLLV